MTDAATTFSLRLPATSANLGSGFDAAAIALSFALQMEAKSAAEFSIEASGRDRDQCSRLEDNLILGIYRDILESHAKPVIPLAIRMHNEIPLGMGCGSSAAGRLAAIALAVHFGGLDWNSEKILEEACALEGHPDNAAACWLGGFVAAANESRRVHVARVEPPASWRAIVVLPQESLSTSKARAALPGNYPSSDVVANIQAVSMLGLAFAQERGDLLRVAMQDRIHQPYRKEMCPMLPLLLPLAGKSGILGVSLSGAGPSILVIVESEASLAAASESIMNAIGCVPQPSLLVCCFDASGTRSSLVPEA